MQGALALLGHFALMVVAWRLDMMEQKFQPTLGDPKTLFLGTFFLYWATVFFLAWRVDSGDWFFKLFKRRRGRWNLLASSILFGLLGSVFFVMGLLPQDLL